MNEELINQVEELGLSNKEARVYIANLMMGPAGVQQIADASGIKRVTTYVILESLVNLGLVSQTSKAKKTLFNAESPENLRRLLEKREQSLQDQKHQLDELLPELDSLKLTPKEAPSVKLYDGVEGLRTVTRDFITANAGNTKVIYGMSNLDLMQELFPEIIESQGNPERLRAGIPSKFIYTSSKGPIFKTSDKERNRESRFIPAAKFPPVYDLTIVGDAVMLMSVSGSRPISVTIQSQGISTGLKVMFDLAWEAAGNYPENQ